MESFAAETFKMDDALVFVLAGAVAIGIAFGVVLACFWWVRREQGRMQKKILTAIANAGRDSEELILTGSNAAAYGELVAQFKVNHGKRVVSILESEGKRFIHVDGEISASERARMVRYLKSEGFMS